MTEEWKDIPGYEGRYQVSNMGRVKSLPKYNQKTERILTESICRGRATVMLCKKPGNQKRVSVHRLVAMAFLPNPNCYKEVNHKDENPLNNEVSNLEWCDHWYNMHYNNLHSRITYHRKPVIGMDCDGNEIMFCGVREAKRNGFDPSGIWLSAHKPLKDGRKRMYKGYYWRYLNDSDRP